MPYDETEDAKKKKKDGAEDTAEEIPMAKEDSSIKTLGKAANQGATKGYWGKGGKYIPGSAGAPVIREEPAVGLGAVAAAAAKKKREDQAAALAGKK